ncbi:unnamed protein product [Closterium sp. Naga37s-1]|nr:unnamed protein product [Closterium sp. Naga37s-1]
MWRVACREARKQVASLTHGPACRGAHGAPAPGGPYPQHSLAHAAPPSAATPHHARLIPSLVAPHGPASLTANATRIGAWRHASPLALAVTSPSLSALRSAVTHSSASLSSATLSAAASLPAAARASLTVPAAGAAAGRAAGVSVWKHYGRCYYELSKTRLRWVGRGSGGRDATQRPPAVNIFHCVQHSLYSLSSLSRSPPASRPLHLSTLPVSRPHARVASSPGCSPPSLLVVATAAAGFVMGSGDHVDWAGQDLHGLHFTPAPLCPLLPASVSRSPVRLASPSLLVVATAAAGFVMGSGDHVDWAGQDLHGLHFTPAPLCPLLPASVSRSPVRLASPSLLVVATAAAGFVMGSGDHVDWAGLGWTSLGTFLAAASANTWNQVYEVANDALMKRTRGRPLPAGRMTRQHAIAWGLLTGASGLAILATQTNSMTAGLGAANIALYAGVYTPLKQLHIANTWVGAVVGAIPPLMGWAAASGGLDAGAAVLAGALYLWQMPHFLALAWLCRKDYAAGGYRMLSLADPTGRRTAAAALRNCCYMLPLGLAAVSRAPSLPSLPSLPLHPFMMLIPHPSHPSTFSLHTSFPLLNPTSSPPSLTVGCTTAPFLWENVLLTGAFTAAAVPFYRNPSSASARQLFRASLLFLPALMAAMLLHRLPHQPLPTHALSPAPAPALTLVPLPSHAPAVMAGAGESRVGGAAAGEQGGREEVGRKAWGETGARRAWEEAAESGERGEGRRRVSLPPVAYYSAAPFPFLPVPHYA